MMRCEIISFNSGECWIIMKTRKGEEYEEEKKYLSDSGRYSGSDFRLCHEYGGKGLRQ